MTERTMTPAEAAALLEVAVDAGHDQVERAYRHQAQRSHPDRLPTATPAERAAAAARFDLITRARTVLRDTEADRMRPSPSGPARPAAPARGPTPAGGSTAPATARATPTWPAEEPYQPMAPAGPWLFWVWVGLYALAGLVSYLGGPLPLSAADFWLRLLPLGLAVTAYARTGWPVLLGAVIALGAVTAVLTVLFASFGPLLAMILLSAPVLGLVAQGRQQQVDRRIPGPGPSPLA